MPRASTEIRGGNMTREKRKWNEQQNKISERIRRERKELQKELEETR